MLRRGHCHAICPIDAHDSCDTFSSGFGTPALRWLYPACSSILEQNIRGSRLIAIRRRDWRLCMAPSLTLMRKGRVIIPDRRQHEEQLLSVRNQYHAASWTPSASTFRNLSLRAEHWGSLLPPYRQFIVWDIPRDLRIVLQTRIFSSRNIVLTFPVVLEMISPATILPQDRVENDKYILSTHLGVRFYNTCLRPQKRLAPVESPMQFHFLPMH